MAACNTVHAQLKFVQEDAVAFAVVALLFLIAAISAAAAITAAAVSATITAAVSAAVAAGIFVFLLAVDKRVLFDTENDDKD